MVDGSIKYIRLNRQTYRFDRDDFPPGSWDELGLPGEG
jgi:hypothetical protein